MISLTFAEMQLIKAKNLLHDVAPPPPPPPHTHLVVVAAASASAAGAVNSLSGVLDASR